MDLPGQALWESVLYFGIPWMDPPPCYKIWTHKNWPDVRRQWRRQWRNVDKLKGKRTSCWCLRVRGDGAYNPMRHSLWIIWTPPVPISPILPYQRVLSLCTMGSDLWSTGKLWVAMVFTGSNPIFGTLFHNKTMRQWHNDTVSGPIHWCAQFCVLGRGNIASLSTNNFADSSINRF